MNSTSNNLAPELDPRWAAVLARDPRADGTFVYGVKTTGIYCHPSSLSRLPNPRNVEFFDTPEQAQAAGYRPSKRVARDQTQIAAQQAARVAAACRQIEAAEELPGLNELAESAGLSPFHFHRVFKAVTGLTPRVMPPPTAHARYANAWPMAARSPRRCTTPASTPTAAFMRQPTRCWA